MSNDAAAANSSSNLFLRQFIQLDDNLFSSAPCLESITEHLGRLESQLARLDAQLVLVALEAAVEAFTFVFRLFFRRFIYREKFDLPLRVLFLKVLQRSQRLERKLDDATLAHAAHGGDLVRKIREGAEAVEDFFWQTGNSPPVSFGLAGFASIDAGGDGVSVHYGELPRCLVRCRRMRDEVWGPRARSLRFTGGLGPDAARGYPELPVFLLGEVAPGSEDVCAVCQEDRVLGTAMTQWPGCRHYFHARCAQKAFGHKSTCPVCRHDCLGYSV